MLTMSSNNKSISISNSISNRYSYNANSNNSNSINGTNTTIEAQAFVSSVDFLWASYMQKGVEVEEPETNPIPLLGGRLFGESLRVDRIRNRSGFVTGDGSPKFHGPHNPNPNP